MNRLKKSILSLLVAIIVFISIIAIVGAKTTNSIGDINADGTVSAADARLALRASVGLEKLTDTQSKSADVNNDNKVTASDARTILRVSVGLEKFDIQENTENKDNSADSYLSTKNVQDMHKVQKSIEQLMMTEEFQNMEESQKIKLILDTLEKLKKNGLIERNSIDYNETLKVINYNHACGISGGISVKQEKTYSDPRLNPIGTTDTEIIANYTRQINTIQKKKSTINSVLMYGYDNVNKNESIFNSWKSLCEEKTALNTTIFACPTVYDFKTALLNKDFICIFEHGNYGGFIEDTYVFAIMNEEVTEERNLAYNTDLYFERIISRTNDKGETNYYITPKFFEFYYKDKLTDAIVYLLSCQGFGKDSIVNYGIADILIEECGVNTVLGFHNSVAQAYGAEIYDNITNLLLKGFTIGDAYDYTIEKLGKSDYTFIKEYLYNFEDMSIRREWLEAANDKKENGAATFLLNGDKSITLFAPSTITGKVTDSETGNPISNVTVEVIDNESGSLEPVKTAITDTNGKYSLTLPYGSYSISFNHENYEYYGTALSVNYEAYEENATLSPKCNSGDDNTGDSGDTEERTVIDSGNCGANGDNVIWTLYEDGELVISGSGAMKDYSSSSSVPWYSNRDSITSATIKDGVTSIGGYAFYYCQSLINTTISSSVTNIGRYAFYGCKSLSNITIPDSVTIIGLYAFSYCESLTHIIIPNNVTEIQNWAFAYTGLVNVIIPENVKTIGGAAFYGCEHLETVKILNGVKRIDTAYSRPFGFECYYGTFEDCTNLTQIIIPESVTHIGSEAFAGCTNLENITIPNSVTSIGGGIFYDCSALKSVVLSNNITNLSESYYYSYNSASSYSTEYYYGFFEGCVSLCEISIPESITNLGIETFAGCANLTTITIPDSVVSIGGGSFYNCSSLKNVKLSNNIKELSYSQYGKSGRESSGFFELCLNLETVTIPDSLTLIDSYSFKECSNLKYITMPNSVTRIGQEVFYNCSSLKNIIISNSITEIPYNTFYKCSSLSEVEIPNSVISIGGESFSNCSNIKQIKIPDSVTSIYYSAFKDCTSLSDIDIGNRTQNIGKNAFYNTAYYNDSSNWDNGILYIETILIAAERDLSDSIFIKSGTTVIADSAFANCNQFSQINIPETVTKISSQAFYGCAMLESVTIPLSVTTIESGAFSFCKKLSEIIILNPNCEIADYKNTICTSSQATIGYYYNGKITGYNNSTAEAYAKKYDITFVALD